MASSEGQSYTIGGVKVQFPCKAYPSQLSMMAKIVRGIDRNENCLLESPTGSGKSLALLCSALAWQTAEYEKQRQEADAEMNADCHGCCCSCHGQAGVMDDPEGQGSRYFPGDTSVLKQTDSIGQQVDGPGDNEEDEDDDDFKPAAKKFRTSSNKKTKRPHVDITYEEPPTLDSGIPPVWSMEKQKNHNLDPCTCSCAEKIGAKSKRKVPKIYFGTRTHKQIKQIAKELGRTAYKYKRMTILASREHTCIDPEVSSMSNKNEECSNKLDGPGCRFFDRVKQIKHTSMMNGGLDTAWDLEDFVEFSRKMKACPYFGTRELKEGADIIFCPYNYLIDPVIRNSMQISLKNQVIILDEAHNIEDSAREAASYSVSQKQLQEVIDDINKTISQNFKPDLYTEIRKLCTGFMDLITSNEEKLGGGDFHQQSKIWNGAEMIAMLDLAGVGPNDFERMNIIFQAIMEDYTDREDKKKNGVYLLKSASLSVLEGLRVVRDFIFRDNLKFMDDYRIAILRTMTYANVNTDGRWLGKSRRGHRQPVTTLTLHFWCMNPAVAFSEIGEEARCVVVTSGTLSPLSSFQSELGVPFQNQLEAAHVIGKSQAWVGTISRGPKNGSLLCNYQNAETFAFQDEIGLLVLEVCKTIPHGVLCFLPSYKMLEKLTNRWESTGLMEKLGECKAIMSEPRASDKANFEEVMKNFYEAVQLSEEEDVEDTGITGALFFAVCRGKVSEGLDFANNNARAVITVGIPFPNIKDTQVELKKQYNNLHCKKRGLLSGSEWYEIQAYRALNQALGRCIRHRYDWGALILVDERYGRNPQKYTAGLSKWVRQRVQYYNTFQQAKYSLQDFTKKRQEAEEAGNYSVMASQTMNESSLNATATNATFTSPPPQNKGNQIMTTLKQTPQAAAATPERTYSLFLPPPNKSPQVTSNKPNANLKTTHNLSQAGGFLLSQPNNTQSQVAHVQQISTPNINTTGKKIVLIQPQTILNATQPIVGNVQGATGEMHLDLSQSGFNPPLSSTQQGQVQVNTPQKFIIIQQQPVVNQTPQKIIFVQSPNIVIPSQTIAGNIGGVVHPVVDLTHEEFQPPLTSTQQPTVVSLQQPGVGTRQPPTGSTNQSSSTHKQPVSLLKAQNFDAPCTSTQNNQGKTLASTLAKKKREAEVVAYPGTDLEISMIEKSSTAKQSKTIMRKEQVQRDLSSSPPLFDSDPVEPEGEGHKLESENHPVKDSKMEDKSQPPQTNSNHKNAKPIFGKQKLEEKEIEKEDDKSVGKTELEFTRDLSTESACDQSLSAKRSQRGRLSKRKSKDNDNSILSNTKEEEATEIKVKHEKKGDSKGDCQDKQGVTESLNIRRSKRKRQESSGHLDKKVDLLDDIQPNIDTTRLCCKQCGTQVIKNLQNVKCVQNIETLPKFLQKISSKDKVDHIFYVDQEEKDVSLKLLQHNLPTGLHLDTMTSEDDGCCFQFFICTCKKSIKNQPPIAAKIVATSRDNTKFREGQMWLYPQASSK